MIVIRRAGVLLRGLLAAVVLVVLVVGVPAALLMTVGNPVPEGWTWNAPLTNSALLGILACVAWVLWAQLLVCVTVETVAEFRLARGRSADWLARVPGTFGAQQSLARALVQTVVAIGATTTAASVIATPWIPHADAATSSQAAASDPANVDTQTTAPTQAAPLTHGSQPTTEVMVARGDTLWSIAERYLGAGERWREIAELNRNREMVDGSTFDDARTIQPGWTLLVPLADTHRSRQSSVIVAPGDNLWEIAREQYGDGARWPRIYHANEARIQDPNRIYPGQRLEIPRHRIAEPPKHSVRHPSDPPPPDTTTPPQKPLRTNHAPPSTAPTTGTTNASTEPPHATAGSGAEHDASSDDPWLHVDRATVARALLSGGGFLAAGMLSVYIGRRRTQSRNRRSGKAAPAVAPHLRADDRALRAIGASASERAALFDVALRRLAELCEQMDQDLPEVVAARIDGGRLDLHLRTASSGAPAPWTESSDSLVWSLVSQHLPAPINRISPYPAMVTVGVDDEGATWFIDLEGCGVVQIVGDAASGADLARFIAAELALNPWSDCESVEVSGIGEDVVPLSYGRLYAVPEVRLEQLAKFARQIAEDISSEEGILRPRRNDSKDAWVPSVSVALVDGRDLHTAREHVAELIDAMEGMPGRTSAVLVAVSTEPLDPRATTLTFGPGNDLVTPWSVLRPNLLTAKEASMLGQLLDDADTEGDVPVPEALDADGAPAKTDQAGSLAEELTEPRCGTGDPESILPRPDGAYVEAAATTTEDLAVLAPAVPRSEDTAAFASDATLDQDLADWADPDNPRPKLRVLGPVELRAIGERTKDVERRPAYYAELAAYLACHPEGGTPNQVAMDFGIQNNTLHTRLGELRKWLGTKPGTEEWYLPVAQRIRGRQVYRLSDALVDADLFRRLRARGEALGPKGIDDFKRALELVAGVPYDQQRAKGYGWLADNPVDHYATAAIVDVAHVFATHSLAEGRPREALWAAEKAIAAAPSEDKPRLDLARATQAMGDDAEATRYLRHEVFNRTDDDRAPLDPSDRTVEVVDRIDRHRRS